MISFEEFMEERVFSKMKDDIKVKALVVKDISILSNWDELPKDIKKEIVNVQSWSTRIGTFSGYDGTRMVFTTVHNTPEDGKIKILEYKSNKQTWQYK